MLQIWYNFYHIQEYLKIEKGANANFIWTAFLYLGTTNVCTAYALEKKLQQHRSPGRPSYTLAITTSTSPSFLTFQFPRFELPLIPLQSLEQPQSLFCDEGCPGSLLGNTALLVSFLSWIQSHIAESLKETQNRPLCCLFTGFSPPAVRCH